MNYRKASSALLLAAFLIQFSAAFTPDDMYTRSSNIVTRLVCILLLLSPGIVFVLLVLAGIQFIIGAENPEQRTDAKKLFKNALIGGIIVVALVNIVRVPPLSLNVSWDACITTGPDPGGGGGGPTTGPHLSTPPDDAIISWLPLIIPIGYKRWLKKRQ